MRSKEEKKLSIQYKNEIRTNRKNYPARRFTFAGGFSEPFVSIIILNRNGKKNLKTLFKSMKRCRFYSSFEIIIVDNDSTDDSLAYIRKMSKYFDIHCRENKTNESFSVANNKAAKKAKGDWLLFLNNDIEVTDGWLDELLEAAIEKSRENPVGAVGARLIYPHIPSKEKNSPKSFCIQHAGIGFRDNVREKNYFVQPYNLKNGDKENFNQSLKVEEKACVTAAVLLCPRKAFDEVGGFYEMYVYGYEDVDLCLKLYKAGYRNYYCPKSLLFHYEFGTQKNDEKDAVKKRRHDNFIIFKDKWQDYLISHTIKDKLNQTHIFTEASLSIAIIADDETKGTASDIKKYIEERGYTVTVIKKHKYKIDVTVDALISLDAKYDLEKVKTVKSHLVKEYWDIKAICVDDGFEKLVRRMSELYDGRELDMDEEKPCI